MGPKKKGKSSSSSSTGTRSSSKPDRGKAAAEDTLLLQLEDVRPMWAATPRDGRLKLLTLDRQALIQRAEQLCATAGAAEDHAGRLLKDVLAEGLAHLESHGSWKVWRFGDAESLDVGSFRSHIHQQHIPQQLLHLLPTDDLRSPERPAEAALRQRMTDLKLQVQLSSKRLHDRMLVVLRSSPEAADKLMRKSTVHTILEMLEALEKEHELLYESLLQPIRAFIWDVLPAGERVSDTLNLENLQKLKTEHLASVKEWLRVKVDTLGTPLKLGAGEEGTVGFAAPELFALTPDGSALTVASKWLQHLEGRLLDKDSHPREVQEGEDPHRMGLVLEWIYGRIVSMAHKGYGAKHQLGLRPPSARQAHSNLLRCLEQQAELEARAKECKDLLNAMLDSRKEADELSKQHDIRSEDAGGAEGVDAGAGTATAAVGDAVLPDAVIMKLLAREALLTSAELHALGLENSQDVKTLNSLWSWSIFARLELEHLQWQQNELAPRAIEVQLELKAACKEQTTKLHSLAIKQQRTELDISMRESQIEQLQEWKATVENLLERFDDLVHQTTLLQEQQESPGRTAAGTAAEETAAETAAGGTEECMRTQELQLSELQLGSLRKHFHTDVRKQLCGVADNRSFFNRLKDGLKQVEEQLEIGRVAVQHLELFLLNVACDDPGLFIGAQLVLPMLQERLSRAVAEFRERLANEVLMLEQEEKAARSSASNNSSSKKAGKKTKQAKRSPANHEPAAAAAVATGAAGEHGDDSTDDDTAVSQQDKPAEAGSGTVSPEPATTSEQGPDDAGWVPIRGRGRSSDSSQQPASGNVAAASLAGDQQQQQQQAAQQLMPQPSPVPLVQQLPVSAQQQAAQQLQHRQAPASMWQSAVPSGPPAAAAATAQAHNGTAGLQRAVLGAPYRPPDIATSAVVSRPYRPLLPTQLPSSHSHNAMPSSATSSSNSSSSRDQSAGVLVPAAADSPVAASPAAVAPSSAAGAGLSASTVSAAAGVRRSRKQASRMEPDEECVLCLDAPRTHGLMHPQAAKDSGGGCNEFSIHRCLCAACAATYDYEKQGCLVCGQPVTIKPVRMFL